MSLPDPSRVNDPAGRHLHPNRSIIAIGPTSTFLTAPALCNRTDQRDWDTAVSFRP